MAETKTSWYKVLAQDERWVDGQLLEEMDRHHRANLIPFLRGNADTLQTSAMLGFFRSDLGMVEDPSDGVASAQAHAEAEYYLPAQDWLEQTPLMRRLCELERDRDFLDRASTAVRNKAYELATGYRKVRHG